MSTFATQGGYKNYFNTEPPFKPKTVIPVYLDHIKETKKKGQLLGVPEGCVPSSP